MKTWFLQLQPRERMIVIGGAMTVVVFVLLGILATLRGSALELREAVGEKNRIFADLLRAEALQVPSSGSSTVSTGESLVVLVDSTARSLGLGGTFTRTRPDGADAISVSFQNAEFDTLTSWMVTLETDYGVSVESASFNGARDAGLVSGQIFLRRP
jgi:type II secretory pathway component PulM